MSAMMRHHVAARPAAGQRQRARTVGERVEALADHVGETFQRGSGDVRGAVVEAQPGEAAPGVGVVERGPLAGW